MSERGELYLLAALFIFSAAFSGWVGFKAGYNHARFDCLWEHVNERNPGH